MADVPTKIVDNEKEGIPSQVEEEEETGLLEEEGEDDAGVLQEEDMEDPSSLLSSSAMRLLNLPLDSLASTASSFASVHGILVERRQTDIIKDKSKQTFYFECAPISLLPNASPKHAYQRAVQVSPIFNQLVDIISQNIKFLQTTLEHVVEVDPFTAKLLELYQEIYHNNNNNNNFAQQADRLGLFRSDYMLHNGGKDIKQVELNTISASFGALATRVAALHRHLTTTTKTDLSVQNFLQQNKQVIIQTTTKTNKDDDEKNNTVSQEEEEEGTPQRLVDDNVEEGVPENIALEKLALALHLAAQNYQKRFGQLSSSNTSATNYNQEKPVILFVVQPGETNTVDQRLLEFQITQAHGWRVLRHSLTELSTMAKVDPNTGALIIVESQQSSSSSVTATTDGTTDTTTTVQSSSSQPPSPQEHTVAVVYYRAGYAPTDYFGDKEWEARKLLEQSVATKSPNLGYHLVGTKKVQQALARPGVLESLLENQTLTNTVSLSSSSFDDEEEKTITTTTTPDKDSSTSTSTTTMTTPQAVKLLRSVFAGLYTLGQDMVEEDYAAVSAILQDGKDANYVLKPQREGGGYNFYGKQMEERLRLHVTYNNNKNKKDEEDDDVDDNAVVMNKKNTLQQPSSPLLPKVDHSVLGEFILMERLFPPEQRAVLLRSGQVEGSGPSISELGCFGTILVTPTSSSQQQPQPTGGTTTGTTSTTTPTTGQVLHNEYAGFLMRTKFSHVDEGGVAAGFATLSSPYLV